MPVRIGDEAPDFTAETTEGTIRFHEWIGDKWAILFSHPKDFTPVCTTELGYMAKLKPEFDKRNTKIIGLSVDPVSDHKSWAKDIEETQGTRVNYPMIGDPDLIVAKAYDMIHPNASGGKRTAVDNATVRNVFIVGPDKKVKAIVVDPKFPPFSSWLHGWIREHVRSPVTRVVNTHYHFDHTQGNILFKGARISAHPSAPELIERMPLFGIPFAVKDNIDVAGTRPPPAAPALPTPPPKLPLS